MKIPIEISARHIHLSQKDLEKLFGKNYELKVFHKISQPGQFAAKEEVELINGKNKLKARILGPVRKNSQAEISITDSIRLKLKQTPKLRKSGEISKVSKIKVEGPKRSTTIPIIIAQRHLHASEKEAKKLKIENKQKIKISVEGKRAIIFKNVIARVGNKHKLSFQLDTDEGNAAGINKKSYGKIIK